jgi:hypothetical protein
VSHYLITRLNGDAHLSRPQNFIIFLNLNFNYYYFFFKFLTSQTVHGCDDGRVPIKVILSSPRLAQIEGVASVGPLPVRLEGVLDREEFRPVCCYLQRKQTKEEKKNNSRTIVVPFERALVLLLFEFQRMLFFFVNFPIA